MEIWASARLLFHCRQTEGFGGPVLRQEEILLNNPICAPHISPDCLYRVGSRLDGPGLRGRILAVKNASNSFGASGLGFRGIAKAFHTKPPRNEQNVEP